jgi:hypothetical protein
MILAVTFLDKIVANVIFGLAKTVTILYVGNFIRIRCDYSIPCVSF